MSSRNMDHRLFRTDDGDVKKMLTSVEGISYKDSPLDFYVMLARYKFACRMLKKDQHVVDVGCGKGYGSVFLSQHAGRVTALDQDEELVSENSIEHSDVTNLNFEIGDLLNVKPEHVGRFDALVSMDVIEHFEEKDVSQAITGYYNLLADHGFAIIGTPNIASRPFASQRRLDTHPFEFTPKQFEEMLASKFKNVFLFSMTDETVSTQFVGLSWYLMAICTK